MWEPQPTTRYQDRVIAHVIGTTVLGSFRIDETIHLLLDIGFVWSIYIDGEMGLLPQTVAISELAASEDEKDALRNAVNQLLDGGGGASTAPDATTLAPAPAKCLITEVEFFSGDGGRRKLLLRGAEADLTIEMAASTGEIFIKAVPKS